MPSIFVERPNHDLTELESIAYESESVLQDLLARHPSILGRLILVKREIPVPGADSVWRLDHLFLDQEGVPTLVEVKRATDVRLRREVVGQMLDYAANAVVYWEPDAIRIAFQAACQAKGIDPNDAIADLLEEEDADPDKFWQNVERNLRDGSIRIVFVADHIPAELQRVIEFLNEQMIRAEVIGIEVIRYADKQNTIVSFVPRVIGETARAQTTKGPRSAKPLPETWQEAFEKVENEDLKRFIQEEVEIRKRPNAPRIGKVYYDCQGQRRWRIKAHKRHGNVWQEMRFKGDYMSGGAVKPNFWALFSFIHSFVRPEGPFFRPDSGVCGARRARSVKDGAIAPPSGPVLD